MSALQTRSQKERQDRCAETKSTGVGCHILMHGRRLRTARLTKDCVKPVPSTARILILAMRRPTSRIAFTVALAYGSIAQNMSTRAWHRSPSATRAKARRMLVVCSAGGIGQKFTASLSAKHFMPLVTAPRAERFANLMLASVARGSQCRKIFIIRTMFSFRLWCRREMAVNF